MKEKDMINPNSLGHYHRDIIKAVSVNRYYVKVIMSCKHTKKITKASYKKYKGHAMLCLTCSHIQ